MKSIRPKRTTWGIQKYLRIFSQKLFLRCSKYKTSVYSFFRFILLRLVRCEYYIDNELKFQALINQCINITFFSYFVILYYFLYLWPAHACKSYVLIGKNIVWFKYQVSIFDLSYASTLHINWKGNDRSQHRINKYYLTETNDWTVSGRSFLV